MTSGFLQVLAVLVSFSHPKLVGLLEFPKGSIASIVLAGWFGLYSLVHIYLSCTQVSIAH
jgi:hypothetical protein